MDWLIERLSKLKKKLLANRALEDVTVYWSPGSTAEDLAKYELPEELHQLYLMVDGIEIGWRLQLMDFGVTLYGRSRISEVSTLMDQSVFLKDRTGRTYETEWWSTVLEEQLGADIYHFYPFDELGQGYQVVLNWHNRERVELYIYRPPNLLLPLALTLSDYLRDLIDYQGLLLWQAKFVGPDNSALSSFLIAQIDLPYLASDTINFRQEESEIIPFFQKPAVDFQLGFSQLRARLDKCKYLKWNQFSLHPGVSLQTLDKIRGVYGFYVPESMLTFYRQFNGVSIWWTIEKDGILGQGMIKILPLEEIFGGHYGKDKRDWIPGDYRGLLWEEAQELEDPEWLEALDGQFPLEQLFDGRWITFSLDASGEPQLFIAFQGTLVPLGLSMKQYWSSLLYHAGIEGWHFEQSRAFDEQFSVDPDVWTLLQPNGDGGTPLS